MPAIKLKHKVTGVERYLGGGAPTPVVDTDPLDTDTVYGGKTSTLAVIKTTWVVIKAWLLTYFLTIFKLKHGIEKAGVPYVSGGNLIIPLLGGEIIYWYMGTRYRTTVEISFPLATGGALVADTQYYFYFNDAIGTMVRSTSMWAIPTDVMVATVTWNGGTGYEVGHELHSHDRNLKWHASAHRTYGTQYQNDGGGTFSAPTASTMQVTPFSIWDEDIENNAPNNVTSARHYFRKNGSSNVTFTDGLSTRAYRINATNELPQYDDGTGTPVDVSTANRICVYWMYFTNDRLAPVAIVLGRGSYTTPALAQAEAKPALPNKSTAEWKFAAKLYYKVVGGVATYQPTLTEDYRTVSTGGVTTGGGITSIAGTNVTLIAPDGTGNLPATVTDAEALKVAVDGMADSGFSFKYLFDTTLGASPATGTIQLNSLALVSITTMYFNETDNQGLVVDSILGSLRVGDFIMLSNASRSKVHVFQVNASFTSGAGVDSVPVTYKFGTGATTIDLTDTEVIYASIKKGDGLLVATSTLGVVGTSLSIGSLSLPVDSSVKYRITGSFVSTATNAVGMGVLLRLNANATGYSGYTNSSSTAVRANGSGAALGLSPAYGIVQGKRLFFTAILFNNNGIWQAVIDSFTEHTTAGKVSHNILATYTGAGSNTITSIDITSADAKTMDAGAVLTIERIR